MLRYFSLLIFCVLLASAPGFADPAVFPGNNWQTVKTETSGWSLKALIKAQQYAEDLGTNAIVVVVDGRIVYQWGKVNKRINMHSVRKSFLSALYGIYIAEGKIDLNQTLAQLDIDDLPPPLTATEKQATVRQLLQARSGVYHDAAYETPSQKSGRPARGSHAPGSFWYYNNWDFNALGAIFEKKVGKPIFEAFKVRIADPIGMQDFDLTMNRYVRDPASSFPAYLFYMSARDMARFGLLYLHKGNWNGTQIIPEAWVTESVKPWSGAGQGIGYGYLWWTSSEYHFGNNLKTLAYSARGNGGQFIVVIPAYDMVIAHNCDREDEQLTNSSFGKLLGLILAARP